MRSNDMLTNDPVLVGADAEAYALAISDDGGAYLSAVAEQTLATMSNSNMLSGPLVGGLLASLVHSSNATSVLEIGTYVGYSAMWMASALASGGKITTCELNSEHADIAQRNIDGSPWRDRIELRRGDAMQTVAQLAADGARFDFAFIDANKDGYAAQLDAVLPLMQPHGVLAFDNTLSHGYARDPQDAPQNRQAGAEAIAAFNAKVAADANLSAVLLTVRDGVLLVRRS